MHRVSDTKYGLVAKREARGRKEKRKSLPTD